MFSDARNYQILFLATFLLLGISTRDWTLRPGIMTVALLSCLVTQGVLSLLKHASSKPSCSYPPALQISWRSATITALGLCLLLRANSYGTMAIAACFAIASKFLFQYRGKHFFNPANFGIIAALTLTHDAWVSPGQWGTDWWYLLLFAGTGGIILKKVGRWDTSATFVLSYTGLEAMRNCWLGWSWDVLQHQLASGSLLLFALFMITDPRSIPNAQASRLIWSVALALLTFILRNTLFLSTAPFWSLFLLAPLTPWLDSLYTAPGFSWHTASSSDSTLPNPQHSLAQLP